jgi:hypothetical protein
MLIEQTHFPHKGPNWGAIILISSVVITLALLFYKKQIQSKLRKKDQSDENKKS